MSNSLENKSINNLKSDTKIKVFKMKILIHMKK